jgi:NTE family protein
MMSTKKPEYGIVLSGGGARGIAHIGVIAALEKHGIIPGVVSGSSMGAIIGALYAGGVSTDEMLNIARIPKLNSLFEWSFPKHGGMLTLKLLQQVLEAHIPVDSFESLKKKLFITVSNISSGNEEVMSEGPLFRAVLASASIPIVFEPQVINGQTYIDGGLFNDMPVDPLIGKCKKIIASHVNYNGPNPDLTSIRSIAERVYRLAIYQNVQKNFSKCDYIIDPPELREHGIFDFKHIDRLFEIGYRAAEALIRQINENNKEKPIIIQTLDTTKKKIK